MKPHAAFKQDAKQLKFLDTLTSSVKFIKPVNKNSSRPISGTKSGQHHMIQWKIPKATEIQDRINMEKYRFDLPPSRRKYGKMFVCPPRAENNHQLEQEQQLFERQQRIDSFISANNRFYMSNERPRVVDMKTSGEMLLRPPSQMSN
jgi:hypothetical protein